LRAGILLLAAAAGVAQPIAGSGPVDPAQATALFKMFLRDSAELPMDVAVTTVVTDAAGRQKRHVQGTIRLLFHGYSQQRERFSFHASAGLMYRRLLNDSMAAELATFKAFAVVSPGKDGAPKVQIVQQGGDLVARNADECREQEMHTHGLYLSRGLYLQKDCSRAEFLLGRDAAGALEIRRYRLDVMNLPASVKLAYLGQVEVRQYMTEGDVQKVYLPGDPKPFLAPKHLVLTIETDKGRVVVTGDHTLAARK